MKIALYLRVSTDRQTTDSQAIELRDYCKRRGWNEAREFSDTSSGARFSRAGLDDMMREVRKGRIDAIVAYKLDRLGRSLPHLAQLVAEMTAHRVALVIPAQGIDTSASNPASQLQLNILMAVAEFEREIIRERVHSGLRAARARGAKFGRPSILQKHLPRVRALRDAGRNVSQIARELMLPYSSAHKLVSMCNGSSAAA
ncbi:MAG TPA: resolvase [Blastocatellia bacterium]|jgi:DNA invertase Pin-like site-specific DNA recombinase|nr:resolvase [Blastocatellia bacterium]